MKEEFVSLLRSTGREGIECVIGKLEKMGFFSAPASSKNHLCQEGGLLKHSLNVYKVAKMLREQLLTIQPDLDIKEESIIIASLLHDVCKADIYKKGLKWRKDEQGRWEQYEAYEVDYTNFPMGHGEKSVMMLLMCGLKMEQDELLAIRWHMGAWNLAFQNFEDKNCISAAANKYPLVTILQTADNLSSHVLEVEKKEMRD